MWNLAEAVPVCSEIERVARQFGKCHIALGGSVLYNGQSQKDLDVIVYRRTEKGKDNSFAPSEFLGCLDTTSFRFTDEMTSKDTVPPSCPDALIADWDYKQVVRGEYLGKRVDFIFVI